MFRDLFNIPVATRQAPPAASPSSTPQDLQPANTTTTQGPVQREGAFITVQSLATFPGAVAAVTLIVNVIGYFVPGWAGSRGLFGIAALIVGASLYYINESDPQRAPKTRNQKIGAIGIALLNTFVILSAAVGTDSMFRRSDLQVQQPQASTPPTETKNV
jgi:hypothetical protein